MIQLNNQTLFAQKTSGQRLVSFLILLLVYSAFGTVGRLLEDGLNLLGLTGTSEATEFQGLAVVALMTLLWTLFSASAQIVFLAKTMLSSTAFIQRHNSLLIINQLAIENVRSLSACILRIPLILIPALIEWIRLMPVPYIVLLNSDYDRGQIDALTAARRFFSSNKLMVVLLTLPLVVSFGAELALLDSPADALPIWSAPVQHIGSIGLIAFIRLVLDSGIFWLYARKIGPIPNAVG